MDERQRLVDWIRMLSLTKKTEYALIALSHLASEEQCLASAREIADSFRVPLPVLTNILKTLTRAGLVESVRGAKGGYRLTLSPFDVTLASVVRAMQGPVRLVSCGGDEQRGQGGTCDLMARCPVRSPVLRVSQALQRFMEEVTLAEVAGADPAGEPASFDIARS